MSSTMRSFVDANVPTSYKLINYQVLSKWLIHRWNIILALINMGTFPSESEIPNFEDRYLKEYEVEYLKFLIQYTNSNITFPKQEYNENVILRFINSVLNDFQACLYFDDGYMRFYAYVALQVKADRNVVGNRFNYWTEQFKIYSVNSLSDQRVNVLEDTLDTYRTSFKRMSLPLSYERVIKLGNQNIVPIYLLEVHIRNCIISNSRINVESTFINFLRMHDPEEYQSQEIERLMKDFIKIIDEYGTRYQSKGNLIELYTKTSYDPQYGGYSIFAIANLIIAAGDIPLSQLLTSNQLTSNINTLVESLQPVMKLRSYMKHLPHIMDIQNLQFSDKLCNIYLPLTLTNYGLFSRSLNEIDDVINSTTSRKVINVANIIETLNREHYHISQVRSPECLLYRSYIIKVLTWIAISL